MRILAFAPEYHEPLIEGIQKSAYETVRLLQEQGHTVDIASQRSYGEPFAGDAPKYILSSAPNKFSKYLSWIGDARAIASEAKKNKYDQVWIFSMDWSFALPLFALLHLTRLPFRIFIFSARECKNVGGALLRSIAKKNADLKIWCASKRIKELLMENGADSAKIICEPVFFTKRFLSQDVSILRKEGTIAYLSSAETGAGIDSITSLAKQLPNFHFILAVRKFGNDAATQTALQTIEGLNLPNLEIKRNISNMGAFLQEVETVILPPRDEDHTMAIPLVALEASFLGCRVLMTNLPVFQELFEQGIAQSFGSEEELGGLLKEGGKQFSQIKYTEISSLISKFS